MGFRPLVGGQSVSVLVLVRAIFWMMIDLCCLKYHRWSEDNKLLCSEDARRISCLQKDIWSVI